jgi:hypothetical protein
MRGKRNDTALANSNPGFTQELDVDWHVPGSQQSLGRDLKSLEKWKTLVISSLSSRWSLCV